MKRFISLFFAISLIFTLSGCDWLRSTLGMPTSEDLERFKMTETDISDTLSSPEQRPADSSKVVTEVKTQTYSEASPLGSRFYVIAGSFAEEANADKMSRYLQESGYKPIRLKFRNGYNVVASTAHKEIGEAYASLRKLLELDFSPEDIWIYDADKQNLHIQTN